MKTALNDVKLTLERRQTMNVASAAGTRITCASGILWVTQHRDARDVLLDAGDSFVLDRPGAAVIQALRPSTLFIREAISGSTIPQAFAVARAALWRMAV
jgi:hypothetical protein